MRKAFLLSCASLLLGGGAAFAQDAEKSWTSGSEVGEGKFIIYNKTLEGYVDGGFSSWGTEGGIYKNPRFYNFTLNGAAYNIDTEISNGGDDHFMQASTWLDGGAVGQTFEIVDAEIPTYRYGNGGKWFGGTAKGTIWTLAADATNTEWLLISEADYKSKLMELEYDGNTYFNATALIKGARTFRNFTNGIDKKGNWTITNTGNINLNGGSDQYRCAEFYNATFDMYQVIENVPNGKYVFSVQGFQRISNSTKPTVIYANEAESPMMSRGEGTATSANSMEAAATAFFNGDFDNNKVTVIVTDHTLKIGMKKETKVAGDDWVVFNNFSLYFYGLDLSELKASIQARLDVANAISGQCEETIKSELATAISNATSALTSNDGDIMAAAQTALNTAIAAAEPSVAGYAAVKAAYDAADAIVALYDELGKAAYNEVVDDIKAAYTAGTLATSECNAKVTAINSALVAAAKATVQPQDGADLTPLIVNPSFESDASGWINNRMAFQTNKAFGGVVGNKYCEFWQPNNNEVGIRQVVNLTAAGIYRITVDAMARGLKSASLFGNDIRTPMDIADEHKDYSVDVMLDANGELNLGVTAEGTGAGASWFAIDNFRLTYVTSELPTIAAIDGKMNAEVKAAMDAAIATYNSEKTVANYNAAATAISDATASIKAYEAYNAALVAQKALIDGTNVYGEGYTAYVEKYNTWVAAYDAGTLKDETVVNPAKGTGWHATTDYNFLLTPWAVGGTQADKWNLGDLLHVNTWSIEGDNDGSNFTVPFFEDWVSSDKTLAANTIEANLEGIENGLYEVSALVRVQVTKDVAVADAAGITLGVNKGEAVDVTNGEQVGTSQFLIGTFKAEGLVKTGRLNIHFNVAEGTNIAWLTFKNVKYTKVRDLTPEEAAIAPEDLAMNEAEATIGRNGIELTVSSTTEGAELGVNWTSSDETVATVADGVVTPVGGNGFVTITATSILDENVKATATITVAQAETTMPATVTVDGMKYHIVGENVIKNGSFEYANPFYGWTAGDGNAMNASNFAAVENEGNVNIKATTGGAAGAAGAIATAWSIEAGKTYIISYDYKNYGSEFQKVSLTNTIGSETNVISKAYNDKKNGNNSSWQTQQYVFTNSDDYQFIQARFRWLGTTSELDNFYLAEVEPVEAELAALNSAIAAVDGNVVGFEAGEYAPYNNIEAIKALAAAKAIADMPTPNYTDQTIVDAAEAALAAVAWTVNATEVNAIYDGDFTLASEVVNQRVTPIGWSNLGDKNYNTRVYNSNELGGNTLAEGAILMSKFATSYGTIDGYTMPLKPGVYSLSFKYGGFNQGNATRDIYLTCGDTKVYPVEDTKNITASETNVEKGNAMHQYSSKFVIETAGDYVLTLYHDNNQNQMAFAKMSIYSVPETSVAMSVSAAKWGTFIAPFDVEVPAGVTASKVTGIGEDNTTLALENIAGAIPANTPVVLYSEKAVSKTFNGQSIAVKNEYTEGLLTGVYASTAAPEGSYVLQSHDGVVGFYEVAETKPTVGANRAYLTVPAEAAAVKAFYFDNATGVNAVEGVEKSDAIYDLSGRRVSNAVKGIYIINGKKVLK